MNKQFYSEQNRSIDSGHEVNFAFENLAEGIYFVRVASSEFSYNEKLIIKK
jgi:hypothetical protein